MKWIALPIVPRLDDQVFRRGGDDAPGRTWGVAEIVRPRHSSRTGRSTIPGRLFLAESETTKGKPRQPTRSRAKGAILWSAESLIDGIRAFPFAASGPADFGKSAPHPSEPTQPGELSKSPSYSPHPRPVAPSLQGFSGLIESWPWAAGPATPIGGTLQKGRGLESGRFTNGRYEGVMVVGPGTLIIRLFFLTLDPSQTRHLH